MTASRFTFPPDADRYEYGACDTTTLTLVTPSQYETKNDKRLDMILLATDRYSVAGPQVSRRR